LLFKTSSLLYNMHWRN